VGAITNEAGLSGRDIGAIRILPRFSLVDVRADAVRDVVEAMRGASVRNRPVKVREDRER
jgi:ATP-dependent RNA helicase DeaD